MTNIVSQTIQRIRTSKVTAVFFIVGFAVSILLISLNTSLVFSQLDAADFKKKNMPPKATQYELHTKTRGSISKEQYEKLFAGIRPETGVIINGLTVHTDAQRVNSSWAISVEYFTEGVCWHYPLIKGRYYTADELKKGTPVVLAGESVVDQDAEEKDGKLWIRIGGREYEIVGIVGNKNGSSLWENRLFIPYSTLPADVEKQIYWGDPGLNFLLYNRDGSMKQDIKVIEKNADQFLKKCHVERIGKNEVEDISQYIINSLSGLAVMAVLGYLVTLIHSVNILMYWIRKMRFEIGLRKACGYTNGKLFGMLYKEILGMCLISAAVALLAQKAAGLVMEKAGSLYLIMSRWNFLTAVLICVGSALLILLVAFKRLASIQPIEIVRGD